MTNTENAKKPAKTPRVDMPCQPAAVRAHNFKEVALGYSLEQAQLEASRCLQCKNPRCRQGCPVEVRIPEFIAQVVKGDLAEAYRILKSTNSLPAVCGRVCPQENQCEGKCILGVKGEPVAIGRLERFVADNAMHDPCVGVTDNVRLRRHQPGFEGCLYRIRPVFHYRSGISRRARNQGYGV